MAKKTKGRPVWLEQNKKEDQTEEGLTDHGKDTDFGIFHDGPMAKTQFSSRSRN